MSDIVERLRLDGASLAINAAAEITRLRALLAEPPRTTIAEKLRKEAARGGAKDGSECCYAPWTCCNPKVLTDAAAELDRLTAIVDTPPRIHDPMAIFGATHDEIVQALGEMKRLHAAEAATMTEEKPPIVDDLIRRLRERAGSMGGQLCVEAADWLAKLLKIVCHNAVDKARTISLVRAAAIEECAKVAEDCGIVYAASMADIAAEKLLIKECRDDIATAIRALAGPNGETKS